MSNVFDGDLLVRGTLRAGALAVPTNSVGNNEFKTADPLAAAKQVHQYVPRFSQASGSAATAETRSVHHAHGAGTVHGVYVGSVVAATGDSTVSVDVRKNGTTILSGAVVLNNANTAYVAVPGTVSGAAYAAGDVFTVVITISAGTGTLPQGVFCSLVLREAAD